MTRTCYFFLHRTLDEVISWVIDKEYIPFSVGGATGKEG
jgi:hypothetical protein